MRHWNAKVDRIYGGLVSSDHLNMLTLPLDLKAAVDQIPGWLNASAAELTRALVADQSSRGLAGDILELGVYRGKYLALLAALTADRGDTVVGVDAFYERIGVLLNDHWRQHAMKGILTAVASTGVDVGRVHLIPKRTNQVSVEELRSLAPRGFRFISIDAGHEAESVLTDLRLATAVLARGGIMALDDVFNPTVPGVAEGTCQFFLTDPLASRIAAFAACGNKLFCTSRESHAHSYEFARHLIELGPPPGFLEQSMRLQRANEENGFTPTFFGAPVIAF